MKDIMVDLETLGRFAGCSLLSIGAVAFDPVTYELGGEFYAVVERKSQQEFGLQEDLSTVCWWNNQSVEARKVLTDSESPYALPLPLALDRFTQYLERISYGSFDMRIWGNGSDFDNAILASCYNACGKPVPWDFRNNRCYRTLKALIPTPYPPSTGTHHNALDDAKFQAIHAIEILGK